VGVCAAGGIAWSSADSGRSWSLARAGTTTGLSGMQFADSAHGWAVGPQVLLATTDGGRSWLADTVLGARFDRKCVGLAVLSESLLFVSEDSIWWWADPVRFYTGARRIRRSTDGGQTWQTVDSVQLESVHYRWGASRLFFLDSLHGWHPGDHVPGNAVRTTDGGESWLPMPVITGPVGGLCFASPDSGWLTDGRGAIWATTNGGDSWLEQSSVPFARGIHMIDSRRGWAAGNDGLLSTDDGGQTWQLLPVADSLEAVHFAGSQHGVAVGRRARIIRTTDGGENWSADSSEFTSTLTAAFMLDSACIWSAGANGLVLGFGDRASGQAEPERLVRTLRPAQVMVRPNPCGSDVTIETSRVPGTELEIHDRAGRRVRRVSVPVGNGGVTVDLRGLPAGVYFVVGRNGGTETPVRFVKVE
ncbi:MAG TPA: T9SS type A sorting domain-containing protein, partial [candidate division WOR-3 bacterium]|nr:T9SS type A sorting domain-containing protein [candidate division WOR-3 bacterium]